ncbi:DNA modification methylase [Halanaeroarchaeum sp. HSR-CO]|uniref:DNA-methyltransferase n=1 Tax=Halanaeroarchaeum sp. HSR-CO TaxID=2866382 RepID=UPI00217F22D9|nr:site-specific DNA-methyltransferase [Halanaeroarchaeum sp. HSR-CO]UWG47000.1 DNA modification methylase [Halanaeroarchaeum sp. HSR-CO]
METNHHVVAGDARDLPLADESVALVVTSPPYPMIEMWDETFSALDPAIRDALAAEDGAQAYDLMHEVLDAGWREVARVLSPGGIAAINVGDATRTVNGDFQLYPNHATVLSSLQDVGLSPLPDVLWRKPANSAAKFMGSGTIPPNAYVTLEHEYILLARKGGLRRPDSDRRGRSSYFWEERNRWFSDVWEVRGERQALDIGPRDRTGAFPFAIPYRLINMYSVQGDTVLDPFWGTGTTTLAAMASARQSVGVEVEADLVEGFDPKQADVCHLASERSRERLDAHRQFVADCEETPGYEATNYDTRVVTKQERDIHLPTIESVDPTAAGWQVSHGWLDG